MYAPFLSNPAARPTGFGNSIPIQVTGLAVTLERIIPILWADLSMDNVSSCARSGAKENNKGRASEYNIAKKSTAF